MQLALRPRLLRPFRLRFVRRVRVTLLRLVRAALREESPTIDPLVADRKDRVGFSIRAR